MVRPGFKQKQPGSLTAQWAPDYLRQGKPSIFSAFKSTKSSDEITLNVIRCLKTSGLLAESYQTIQRRFVNCYEVMDTWHQAAWQGTAVPGILTAARRHAGELDAASRA